MWIETFGANGSSGTSGGDTIRRRGFVPKATLAISSMRFMAMKISGIRSSEREPVGDGRARHEVVPVPIGEQDRKPRADDVGGGCEQRGLAGGRAGERKDRQRQQHADQHGDAGELPVIGVGDRPGPGELRLARGVEHAPVGADAAFEGLPRLVVGFDDVVVDAERLGAGDEAAQHAGLHQRIGIGVAAVVARARPAELGDHDALAGIGLRAS